ncbi:MAG: hypothetical protein RJA79_1194 [Actinomycetota bacterium]
MNQLTERSVGKPGSFVSAKKVPEKESMLKIGMASVGINADGSRRVLINPRLTSCHELRIVVECISCVDNDVETVFALVLIVSLLEVGNSVVDLRCTKQQLRLPSALKLLAQLLRH